MKTPHQLTAINKIVLLFCLILPLNNQSIAQPEQSSTVSEPTLLLTLADRWEEAWLGSPAAADIDGDDQPEIIVPRYNALVAWSNDGTVLWKYTDPEGRIFGSPIVADFRDDEGLEIAFASGDKVYMLDGNGNLLSGFPVSWESEIRGLAAGDIDGDGDLELVASLANIMPVDMINAWNADGSLVSGFPPIASGTSGCDENCIITGVYDQSIAIGDLDGDSKMDIVAPMDARYAGFYKGSGEAFDANAMFEGCTKVPGVPFYHDLDLAKQGWSGSPETDLQSLFSNTTATISDIDRDGNNDIILLGTVTNVSYSDRNKGVALWVVKPDASRITGWEAPFYVSEYLAGGDDFSSTNLVSMSLQVALADIDDEKTGPEMIFAGYDGKIHAVAADKSELWTYTYTTGTNILTNGVVIGDLSNDDVPEIIFTTYSTEDEKGALFILDANGNELHKITLPRRGSMSVPTLADIDIDGTVEIIVSLKDAQDQVESVLVYTVSSSAADNLPWPTGRGNYLRTGCWEAQSSGNSIAPGKATHSKNLLIRNHPNPFTSTTQISFYLKEAGEVSIEVYNILGKKVDVPAGKFFSPGYHDIVFDGSALPEGVYFYKLKLGDIEGSGRMVKVE